MERDTRRRDKFQKGKKYHQKEQEKKKEKSAGGRHGTGGRRGNEDMVRVWHDTVGYFQKNRIKFPDPELIDIEEIDTQIEEAETKYVPAIDIRDIDTLNMAIEYVDAGLDPMVLNMASEYKPGGGVRSGSTAQEEEIFRRSNAHLTHPAKWYPIVDSDANKEQVIYSPEVTVCRSSRDQGYKFIDHRTVAILACPAVRRPRLYKGKYKEDDYETMVDRIEAIFLIAIENKHDSLVLGALGCGAFGNPPDEVSDMFKQMVDKYGYYFKKIGFAILVAKDRDQPNLDLFKKKLL